MTEFRHALRCLLATPLVSAVAVASLALGIGANCAIFSLVDGLLLKSLPVREPERLALVDRGSWTNPIWEAIRGHEGLFDGAFAWSGTRFNLARGGETEFIDGVYASGRYFDVLGIPPVIGRTFTREDDQRGGGPAGAVAVLGYGFWQRRFGGSADILGRTLILDTVPFTIIGVTPRSFVGIDVGQTFDVIVPLADEALIRGKDSSLDRRQSWWLQVMVRTKPGQPLGAATRQLRSVQPLVREATMPPELPAKYVADYLKEPFELVPAATGNSYLRQRYQRPLLTLMVVAGLVLLIACANIANLLLARATTRRHELAVRLALGASRIRLARPLLAESLLLASTGTLLGMLCAMWGSRLLVRMLSTSQRMISVDLSIDWRILVFASAMAVATALLFGAAPAFRASQTEPNRALSDKARGSAGGARTGLSGALIVVQVSLSVVLVVAAGLFVRTFTSLATRDIGFDSSRVLVVNVDGQAARIAVDNRLSIFEQVRQAAAVVPGVERATLSVVTPVSGSTWMYGITIPGMPERTGRDRGVYTNLVTPGWFATYGMRIVSGRDISPGDTGSAPGVAVVNPAFVTKYLNGQPAVGRVIREADPRPGKPAKTWEIVGVASDAVYGSLREPVLATMYLAYAQSDQPGSSVRLSLRSLGGRAPGALAHDVATAIGRVNPGIALTFRDLDSYVSGSMVQERLIATLSGFFGVLGLLLAGLGLYGLTAYTVSRRRGEIGIRMALGADATAVVRTVVGRLAMLVAAGLVAGALVSWWASRFVESLLYGLTAREASTPIVAVLVLAVAAGVAAWLPARRAARINPVEVLRE
jgi:putative ABC transport system permease protein